MVGERETERDWGGERERLGVERDRLGHREREREGDRQTEADRDRDTDRDRERQRHWKIQSAAE